MKKNDFNIQEISALILNCLDVYPVLSEEDEKLIEEHKDKNESTKDIILNRRCNFMCDGDEFHYVADLNVWRKMKVQ